MNTRFRLGISSIVAAAAAVMAPQSQAAVTVIGGGLAKACYEAVEYARISASRAIAVCDLAIDTETMKRHDRAATFTNRGILHMRMGNNQRALVDYQRSLQLEPNLGETKVNIGAALYGLKRYPEAMKMLNEGLVTDSADARATGYYNRALTHEKLGDVEAAYADFKAALQVKPEFEAAAKQLERFSVVETSG